MILVVGATGLVGGEICRKLIAKGEAVRALVRETSDPDKVKALEDAGVELARGDLRDVGSLERAIAEAQPSAIISTVSSMPFSYQAGVNDIATTDLTGHLNLIRAASKAGVGHLTYLSFSRNLDRDFPLRNAKRGVEAALIESGIEYTILRPSCFMEVWLGPATGFDYSNARATIYGDGTRPIAWIAVSDVAEFAVRSLEAEAARNAILEIGGPQSIAPLEAVSIFERVGGRPFERHHVPVEALDEQTAGATDDMAKSFATLMRCVADGDAIEMGHLLKAIPVEMTSVESYAERVLGKVPAHAS